MLISERLTKKLIFCQPLFQIFRVNQFRGQSLCKRRNLDQWSVGCRHSYDISFRRLIYLSSFFAESKFECEAEQRCVEQLQLQ